MLSYRRGIFDPFPKGRNESAFLQSEDPMKVPPGPILFLFLVLFLGVLTRIFLDRYNMIFSYTVVISFIGILFGILSKLFPLVDEYTIISNTQPLLLMVIFLPIIVFHTGYTIDLHMFWKSIPQIIIVTLAGFFMQIAFVGLVTFPNLTYKIWSFETAMMLGIMCTPTQPEEIISILSKTVVPGSFKQVMIMLQGESLINISISVFTYTALSQIMDFHYKGWVIIRLIAYEMVLGILAGFIAGKIISKILQIGSNDAVSECLLLLSYTYLIFYIAQLVFGLSGVLVVITMALLLNTEKAALATEVEITVSNFLSIMVLISNTLVFVMTAVVVTEHIILESHLLIRHLHLFIPVTYIFTYTSRFLTFMALIPILNKLGYGLSARNAILLVFGGLKSSISILLGLAVIRNHEPITDHVHQSYSTVSEQEHIVLIHVAMMVVLSMLINPLLIKCLIRFFNMDEISVAKKVNMESAMKHIIKSRHRSMEMLKMDRDLNGVNWLTVKNATEINSPYSSNTSKKVADSWEYTHRISICPDCKQDIRYDHTHEDLMEVAKEVNFRIIRAKKVSYRRQFEERFLTKDDLRALIRSADMASDSPDAVLYVKDISSYWKPGPCLEKIKECLTKFIITQELERMIPLNRCRRVCYRISTNSWFIVFIFIMNMLSIVMAAVDHVIPNYYSFLVNTIINSMHIFFCFVFILEFIIKITGLGRTNYFASFYNKIDFVLLGITTVNLVFFVLDITHHEHFPSHSVLTINLCCMYLRALHMLRIFTLIRLIVPKVLCIVDNYLDRRLLRGYHIAQSYATGQNEVIKSLRNLIDLDNVLISIQNREKDDRQNTMKELGLIQRTNPLIPISVKTLYAAQFILNKMIDSVNDLKNQGLLDDMEVKLLKNIFDDRIKCVHSLGLVNLPTPQKIMAEVFWLFDEPEVTDYLIKDAELICFEKGDILINYNDSPKGIYIVTHGLLKCLYRPSVKAIHDLKTYGALPNCDYVSSCDFQSSLKDYIFSGSIIGELGVLTRRQSEALIACETPCEAYFIEIDNIQNAMIMTDYRMESRMWKSVATRVAVLIARNSYYFQHTREETLKYNLQRALVPDLSDCKMLTLNDMAEDVFLIEGTATDANSKIMFIGPNYITHSVQQLLFNVPQEDADEMYVQPRLIIVPVADIDVSFVVLSKKDRSYALKHSYSSRFCRKHGTKLAWNKISSIATNPEPPTSTMGHTHVTGGNTKVIPFRSIPYSSPSHEEIEMSLVTPDPSEYKVISEQNSQTIVPILKQVLPKNSKHKTKNVGQVYFSDDGVEIPVPQRNNEEPQNVTNTSSANTPVTDSSDGQYERENCELNEISSGNHVIMQNGDRNNSAQRSLWGKIKSFFFNT